LLTVKQGVPEVRSRDRCSTDGRSSRVTPQRLALPELGTVVDVPQTLFLSAWRGTDEGVLMEDSNSASKADLMTLMGIGDAHSQKIIDGRPYARKDQLVSKKILPQATYDKIKELIVAKQAKK
jgi:hypothetical protein